ncbi:nuclease-related domain-containing DEAD/DEAH box helicase [Thorsellia anophelis]|uniref:DNA 3'-5' helicase II n=1 Tax=Thorsellia anophelis DSM 18579 TaxID=1123402 RepID=A0A1I0D1G0_9GAMM|nr:NERD domain-containing protein [Thorsellia anophelis]SET26014.1 Part of AAA domain-containing protein [Thorsellia anophelis DSM 18579]
MQPYHLQIGAAAEKRVQDALSNLPLPWQIFESVEWRNLSNTGGEQIGESDIIVFHPNFGVIVIEIKANGVYVANGTWHYESGRVMKSSPFSQARRNKYALIERIKSKLKPSELDNLIFTHAVWFPDIIWNVEIIDADCPARSFILDRNSLGTPENHLMDIFNAVIAKHKASKIKWAQHQIRALHTLLAPTITINQPLRVTVDDSIQALEQATLEQIEILSILKNQNRLLVEGGAGSGKTRLALFIAKQHANIGKRVLFTCFNKQLAQYIATSLSEVENLTVLSFHELVKLTVQSVGMPYTVPSDKDKIQAFFQEESPEHLFQASVFLEKKYDTIIVDEANDFLNTWWIALESLGVPDFNWYCFYDRQQILYVNKSEWEKPFKGKPFKLEHNLRNTRPIGEFAAMQGNFPLPNKFRVDGGIAPKIYSEDSTESIGKQLNTLLSQLIDKEYILPEQIAILYPYNKLINSPEWLIGTNGFELTDQCHTNILNKIKYSTIQSFKGLESDVVILFGLDDNIIKKNEILYIGCSRAKSLLYIINS